MRIFYSKSNAVLMEDDDGNISLFSYQTEVLRIEKGKIVIDGSRKNTINYDGIQSVTTSKHITQAKDYIENELGLSIHN